MKLVLLVKKFRATVRKPILLIGTCVTFAAIVLLFFFWIASDEAGRLKTNERFNHKTPETGRAERKWPNDETSTLNTYKNEIKEDHNKTQSNMKNVALPDELILGMSRSELDAFHKKQMVGISKQMSNPHTKVELPPSDDILPSMTLRELDAIHRQQTISSKKRPIEFVQSEGSDTFEARDAAINQDELDQIHREQSIQTRSGNPWVELPSVSAENEFQSLTLDQLDEMLSRQQLAADFDQVDDTKQIILPPSSDGPLPFSNWDVIELHAQQEELIKQ